jgi:glutaminyl-tRNA synthetase
MYDYAHPLSDAIEQITHSICTLEFEDHRPLYDWCIENLNVYRPQQIEFARLNLTHTVMSKRKLRQLVEQKMVNGWDDPRMPTISGLRRRGFTPDSIRDFCERIGVAKSNSIVDYELLEHCVREDLNMKAGRVMAVLRPLKLVIENYPEGQVEWLEAENNPENPAMGSRKIPFSRDLFVEQDDFMENPPGKFFRLAPGREVRLKHAYIIKCEQVVKDKWSGEVVELRCSYDPETKSGGTASGRKVKGTLHWVSAAQAKKIEVRLYNHLLVEIASDENDEETGPTAGINPDSLVVLTEAMVEPSLSEAKKGERFQFLRHGYFCVDSDSTSGTPVFNRIVALRDSWAKAQKP